MRSRLRGASFEEGESILTPDADAGAPPDGLETANSRRRNRHPNEETAVGEIARDPEDAAESGDQANAQDNEAEVTSAARTNQTAARTDQQAGQGVATSPSGANAEANAGDASYRARFNDFFADAMAAFPPTDRDEGGLTQEALDRRFTPTQHALIRGYFDDPNRTIPEGLFNGDERSADPPGAGARMVMSARILSDGFMTVPGTDGRPPQRIHARMCGHWVQIVRTYAGLSTSGGRLAGGVMGTMDHSNRVVLGGAEADYELGHIVEDESRRERRESDLEARRQRQQQLDAMPEGQRPANWQRERDDVSQQIRRLEQALQRNLVRREARPRAEIAGLQPGDWIWYYNDNDSGSGDHSVVFAGWETPPPSPSAAVPDSEWFGEAQCYSQHRPEEGGARHKSKIGRAFSPQHHTWVVTYISRTGENDAPATTLDEMIGTPAPDQAPGGNQNGRGRNGQRRQRPPSGAVDANGTYLATLASRNHVDRASLERAIVTWLRDANQRRLDQLRPGDAQAATPETRARFSSRAQWQTLVDENARADLPLEQRVRIYQRLQGIQTNAELIQQATDAREEALNSLHSDPNLEYCQAAFHALNRLQSRFGPVRDVLPAISGLPTHRRSSSRSERIAELRQQMQEIEPSQAAGPAGFTLLQYFEAAQTDANLRNGARLAEAQRLYGELSRRAREVAGLARLVASRRDEMTQELASPLTQFAAIAQGLSSAVSDAVRHLPYITTHLGSTDSDVSASTTGALSDVLRGHVAEIVASLPRENARAPASGAE